MDRSFPRVAGDKPVFSSKKGRTSPKSLRSQGRRKLIRGGAAEGRDDRGCASAECFRAKRGKIFWTDF